VAAEGKLENTVGGENPWQKSAPGYARQDTFFKTNFYLRTSIFWAKTDLRFHLFNINRVRLIFSDWVNYRSKIGKETNFYLLFVLGTVYFHLREHTEPEI
jgi:hypothetical protein